MPNVKDHIHKTASFTYFFHALVQGSIELKILVQFSSAKTLVPDH